jgi:hypothetical protein
MGLLKTLAKVFQVEKKAKTCKTELERKEALYDAIVTESRFFWLRWREVDWEEYRKHSRMIPEFVKLDEWDYLNNRIIKENLVPRAVSDKLGNIKDYHFSFYFP